MYLEVAQQVMLCKVNIEIFPLYRDHTFMTLLLQKIAVMSNRLITLGITLVLAVG